MGTKPSATKARKMSKHLDRLTVEYLPITKIKPYDRNPRRNRPAVQKTAASLKEFGWRQPIVVDRDMVIVVGHTRYMAAQLLGQYTVPVHIARNLTPEQAKAYRIADLVNMDPPYGVDYESTELGGIEGDDQTQDDLLKILVPAFKHAVTFSQSEAAFYIWHGGGPRRRDFEFAMDAAGIEEKQMIMWVKEHFVMGRADYHWQNEPCFYAQKKGQRCKFYGDRKQPTVWRLSLTRKDHACEILIETGLQIGDGAGNNIYVSRAIPRNKKPPHLRIVEGQSLLIADGSTQSDAWLVMRDQDKYQHPTQKPTALATRAIENSSIPGQTVLDLFGGGGFTLLGCEATGRQARIMEKSRRWCDVEVSRWAKQTGKEPRRA